MNVMCFFAPVRIATAIAVGVTTACCTVHTNRACPPCVCRIVISEIMSAPRRAEPRERFDKANWGPYTEEADDDSLQYVEMHNPNDVAVDLTGWSIGGGITYPFPSGTRIEPGAYLVVAADPTRLASIVGVAGASGPFRGRLSHSGEAVSVHDASGVASDRVAYGALPPWPMRPATRGASLERMSLADQRTTPDNWRASVAPLQSPAVGTGTPGRSNSVAADVIPPFISALAHTPDAPAPGQDVTIIARVTADAPLTSVEVLATTGLDSAVTTTPMLDDGLHGDGACGDGLYGATLHGGPERTLVHYRVRATASAATSEYPYANDPAPTRAYYHKSASTGRFHLFVRQPDLEILKAAAAASPRRDTDVDGTLVIDSIAYPHIRVSLGGRWPRAQPPFAWHFKFNSESPYRGLTTLHASHQQPDLQQAMFDAFAAVGLPHLSSELADLFLTTDTVSQPWARYVVFEVPSKRWLKKHDYPSDSALYKARSCESTGPRRNSDLYYFGDPGNERAGNGLQTDYNYQCAYADEVTPFDPPNDVRELVAAVGDLSDADLQTWLDRNVDVDLWFRWIALHVYLRLSDFATHNYYILRPPGGRWQILGYDFDQFASMYVLPALYAARQDARESADWQRNRLHERIASSPTLKRIYLLTMRALLDAYPVATLIPASLRPPVEAERAALYAELASANLPPSSAAPVATPCSGRAGPGTTVTLTVPAGYAAYYTLDGSDPRLSPTRILYSVPIPIPTAATLRSAALSAGQPPSTGAWTDRTDCTFKP